MAMLSFRVDDSEAANLSAWAEQLNVERSELLRRALHTYLTQLRSEADALAWEKSPPMEAVLSLADIADWGPIEDWSDWADTGR